MAVALHSPASHLVPMKKRSNTPAPGGRKRITFAWPDGQAPVAVAGDFSNWEPLPLKPQAGGQARTMYLPPGHYEYRFVINGEWCSDPACPEAVPNPFGSSNSVLRVA